MARKTIRHLNYISGDINYVAQSDSPDISREIYCKRLHKICEPLEQDCASCPYFGGLMQGYGHECIWQDLVPVETEEWTVYPEDVDKELLRVSQLIDKGYVKKG